MRSDDIRWQISTSVEITIHNSRYRIGGFSEFWLPGNVRSRELVTQTDTHTHTHTYTQQDTGVLTTGKICKTDLSKKHVVYK